MALSVPAALAASFNNADSPHTTASFKPTDGRVVIAAYASSSDVVTDVSLAGGGVTTWTKFAELAHGTGTNQRKIWLFRAYQATYGAAATATFTTTGTGTSGAWIIFEIDGADTSGTNGSGAIVQTPTATGTTETTATVTMASFGDATNNGAFGFVDRRTNGAITEEAGYTEIGEQSPSAPGHTLEVEWKIGEDLAVTAAIGVSTTWGIIGVEIKVAGGATYTKAGTIISAAAVAGPDVFTATETGTVVSAVALSGPSATGAGTTYEKAGTIISAAAVAAADVFTAAETGAVISAAVLKGPDVFTAVETGIVKSAVSLSGPSAGAVNFQTYNENLPSIAIECSFTTTPLQTPVWVDISEYVRGYVIDHPWQGELSRVEAATCTILLDNADRRFDSTYATGAYYPNVKKMKRVRIRVQWDGVTYARFSGFATGWKPVWGGESGNDAWVALTCVDLFKVLNLTPITGLVAGEELTGARIDNGLDWIGWSATDRDVNTGFHTCVAETAADETTGAAASATGASLAYFQDVAASEDGSFFVDGAGTPTFHDGHHRRDLSTVSQATFGDGAGEIGYTELDTEDDDAALWNDVTVSYVDGEETIENTTSKTDYLTRHLDIQTRLVKAGEAAALGSLYLWRRQDPDARFPGLRVEPVRDEWATVLPLTRGDLVTVVRRPPGGGTITQPSYVEGWREEAGESFYRMTFDVSPAETATAFWVLGTSTLQTGASPAVVGY